MQDDYGEFQALNTEILAISVEEPEMGRYVSELLQLQYPVLTDEARHAVDLYGVYNLLGDSLATPSVFVIDQQGVIRWEYIGQSSGDRPTNGMILDQVRLANQSQ
ncbi:MAG TPA: redoxin domain-containing protein [Chloroflexi bacterium]|nr:redoxin domain-containing protein [Chloroflexota bacterium]